MLTTCPECRTTFRIDHAKLEARRGLVRCGACRTVFNAYDSLLPDFEAPPAPVPAQDDGLLSPPPPPAAEVAAVTPPDGDLAAPEPAASALAGPVTGPGASDVAADSTDAILLSALPVRAAPAPERTPWLTAAFGALSLLLGLALIGQAAYFLRGPLIETWPVLRPGYVMACEALGCGIPLARRLDSLRVEASSLETDPEQPSRARLRVSLSNRSETVQAWPHLLLRLTDLRSAPQAQRIFSPKDYLPQDMAEPSGMAAMSEVEVRLDLDLGGLTAAGYEVRPHYP